MRNWWTKTLLAAALAYPTGALLAQPQQQPPAPAPAQPAPAPQPANDGDPGDEADAARAGEAVREDQRAMEMRLRELAEQQRAVAVRAQQGAIAEVDALRRFKGKTEKAAWLGVSTSKVPQALRHHAKLKNKYTGLIVERVEPGSPADTAGLEQFDIIE